MTQSELQKLLKNAWSFPGKDPPVGAEELGTVDQDGTTYFLYRGLNEEGEEKIFYETERGYQFKRYMEDLQKKRQKRRRCMR